VVYELDYVLKTFGGLSTLTFQQDLEVIMPLQSKMKSHLSDARNVVSHSKNVRIGSRDPFSYNSIFSFIAVLFIFAVL